MQRARRSSLLLATLLVLMALSCDKDRDTPPVVVPPPPSPTPPISRGPVLIPPTAPGAELKRSGDEIMVAGRMFHTGARVVLWTDPGGYDAYRSERRFAPWSEATWVAPSPRNPAPEGQPPKPQRYATRDAVLNWPELDVVRGGGWPLELLQQKIDQFVIHYDVVGASKFTFRTLHDERGLSVHFMLDIDGTIYQTLDVKERAYHATTANYRSVGIEIANRGGYESDVPLREFYSRDGLGTRISLPPRFGDGGILNQGIYRPERDGLIRGTINGLPLVMYDFTPQQYEALAKLTATLCTVLPKITLQYPVDSTGRVIPGKLSDASLERYQGILGHFHIQDQKYDPGPAFQWEKLMSETRSRMTMEALEANARARGQYVRPGALATQPSVQQQGVAPTVPTPPPLPPPRRPAR